MKKRNVNMWKRIITVCEKGSLISVHCEETCRPADYVGMMGV